MSVQTLRAAIAVRARELRGGAIVASGVQHHKKHWHDCPCNYCATKREATVVIGQHAPRPTGVYTSGESLVDMWRERERAKYRKRLAEAEEL